MTVTANIHYNLAAWASGTSYAAGNRVSSNGNAYQAISSGNAGGTAPTGTSSSVSDGGVSWKYLSHIDYSNLNDWAAAIPAAMTDNYVAQIWNNGPITTTAGNGYCYLGGYGTPQRTGGYSFTIKAAPGESFRDTLKAKGGALAANQTNGVTFLLPNGAGYCNYFDIYETNVFFDGLQFIDPYSTSNCTIVNGEAGTTLTVAHCIFDGYAQADGAFVLGGDTLHVYDSLFVDRTATGTSGNLIYVNTDASTIVNSTCVRVNRTNGSEGADALQANVNPIVRNCLIFGYTTPVGGNTGGIRVDHMITDAASVGPATDAGNNTFNASASNQFVSATSDFRLKLGSIAIDAAVTDTTDVAVADDIIGYSRPQGTAWDIGAAEFVGQFTGTGTIGPVAARANMASINNASATKPIGAFRTTASAQQFDMATAAVPVVRVTTVAAGTQTQNMSGAVAVGTFSAIGNLSANNLTGSPSIGTIAAAGQATSFTTASATVVSPFSAQGGAIQSYVASGVSTAATITGAASVVQYNTGTGRATLAPITSSQAGQFTTATAAPSIGSVQSAGAVVQGDIATSLVTFAPVSPVIAAAQYSNAVGQSRIRLTASSTSQQIAPATGAASLGFIVSSGGIVNSTAASAVVTVGMDVAAGRPFSPDYSPDYGGTAATGRPFSGDYSPAFGGTVAASAAGSAGSPFIVTATAQQVDLLTLSQSVGSISVAAVVTNPMAATGAATIGSVTAGPSQLGAENVVTSLATLGPVLAIGSSALVASGAAIIPVSATGIASNPYPASAQVTVPLSASGGMQNLLPILASAAVSLPLTTRSAARQDDFGSATVTLPAVVRATISNAPPVRVSQSPVEVLSRGGNLRVSQAPVEVLISGGTLRVSQTQIEVLTQSAAPSAARVSQVVGEILALGTPRAVASQVVQQVLTGGTNAQNVRMSQIVTETLVGGSATQNVRMTQIVLETLMSAVPLPVIGTTFIAA